MAEIWKDITGFEGRYQVSSYGRVKALSFMQRYLLRNGAEAFRKTRERIVATQAINSGYMIVHLHKDNKRTAALVHRLVAGAFLGQCKEETINHKNGAKTDNRVENLEWASYAGNHLHAVANGLNTQAIRVVDPATGRCFDSISQAARGARKAHRTVRATFIRSRA